MSVDLVTGLDALKAAACETVGTRRDDLVELSSKIHANVELAFEEHQAQHWLCELLEANGLTTERGLGSLSTAFRARAGADTGPRIAVLCEYDGLSIYGQSCGHNVVAAAGLGAMLGVASVIDELPGSVVVLGTPGEEGGGGKKILAAEGFFDDIDAMMLVYPGMYDIADSRAVGATRVEFEYFGRAAHASAHPELGVNALDAILLAFNGVSALRQQLPSEVRLHGMIKKGGTLPQVIPDHTVGVLTIRANDDATLERTIPRVDACLEGAATMSGCRLERKWGDTRGRPLLSNTTMAEAYAENMARVGRKVRPRDELSGAWSGDTSSVSWSVPTIQPQMAMTPLDVAPHSHEFHAASIGPAAEQTIVDAAQSMAMTVIDLLARPELLAAAREEFDTATTKG